MNTPMRISRIAAAGIAALMLALAVAAAGGAQAATGVATGQPRAERATQMLFDAVHTNDFAAAEAAVAAGASVEARDRWDTTPIELAIDKGYFRIAHFLVSVRNSRASTDTAAASRSQPAPAPQQAASAPAPAQPVPVQPAPAVTAALPQWPADRPNPFDPSAPSFGTGLPLIAPSGAAAAEPSRPEDGPMLATDEAIQRRLAPLR